MKKSNEKYIGSDSILKEISGSFSARKRVIIFAALITLSGCQTLQERAVETKYVEPVGITLLSESDIRTKVVGNTIEGESSRKPGNFYVEHYLEDGTIKEEGTHAELLKIEDGTYKRLCRLQQELHERYVV